MSPEPVSTLAAAASQIGPDFYGILLVTVVAAASGRLLLNAQRIRPSLSDAQLRPYRLFFYLSCAFGMAAITVSIGWWLYRQAASAHTVQIAITNVTPDITIESKYFSRKSFRKSSFRGQLIVDEYFLIVSDRPFSEKDRFAFDIIVRNSDASKPPSDCESPGGVAKKHPLEVPFSGKLTQSFSLELDSSSLPSLRSVASSSTSQWFSRAEIQVAELAVEATK
ncbi:hypothetical protein [Azoarcus olearius]|uniref:hypothetical protein n=1 Tax=Azoarcus sp. (strain BH72) TaxID=418699 RepID=UPI0011D26903|nr:hypothetical protein [Azoarcus olearius]